jgi:hypothetical protein
MNHHRRNIGAMTAARCQIITTMHGATGKNVHVATNNFSAAIVIWKSQKNNPIKLSTKEAETI